MYYSAACVARIASNALGQIFGGPEQIFVAQTWLPSRFDENVSLPACFFRSGPSFFGLAHCMQQSFAQNIVLACSCGSAGCVRMYARVFSRRNRFLSVFQRISFRITGFLPGHAKSV